MSAAIFNQLPLIGVYSGMMPCAISQQTKVALLWPARLSRISNTRNGGNASSKVKRTDSPACQRAQAARFAAASGISSRGGRAAMIAVNSCCSQGCNTVLGVWVTPLTRNCPVAG